MNTLSLNINLLSSYLQEKGLFVNEISNIVVVYTCLSAFSSIEDSFSFQEKEHACL